MNRAIDTLPALPCTASAAPVLRLVSSEQTAKRPPTHDAPQRVEDRPARLPMNTITVTSAPHALRVAFDPAADDDATVLDTFAACVKATPYAEFDGRTYDAIDRSAARIASALARLGIGTGDRVAIVSTTGLRLDAMVGVLSTGAAFIAVDGNDPIEAARQAREAGYLAVVGARLAGLSQPVVDPDSAVGGYVDSACAWPGADVDDVACVVMSRGRAVALTHREVLQAS